MAEKPERQLKKQSIKEAKYKSSRKRHSGCFYPLGDFMNAITEGPGVIYKIAK